MWNQLDYRPIEGYVYAVTQFNFTSIAGNLPTAPALMVNTVIWKPAASAMLSEYYIMKLLAEAGLPPGALGVVAVDDDIFQRPGPRVVDAAKMLNAILDRAE